MRNLFIFLTVLGFSQSTHAEELLIFDFDDCFVEAGRVRAGSFETPRILFKMKTRSQTLYEIPEDEPDEIRVTPEDFEKIRIKIGEGDGEPGVISQTVTLSDGTTIHPGFYYIRGEDTYRHFREGSEGQNYLLEDIKKAVKAEKPFKGPYYDVVKAALNDKEAAQSVVFLTARGHTQKEWDQFWNYLIRKGEIKYKPREVIAVSRPEYDIYGLERSRNIAKQKVEILEQIIKLFVRMKEFSDSDRRLDGDGLEMQPLHYIAMYEDDPVIHSAVFELFRSHAMRKVVQAKFGLFHAGSDAEVESTGMPRHLIIRKAGTYREAKPEEIAGELTKRAQPDCKASVSGLKEAKKS